MKFGQPLITSQASGALGGLVGSSSRGGVNYFRVRAIPGNPRSPVQTKMRLILTSLAAAWASILTDLQRAGWAGLSSGSSSGIDAYVRANTNILLATQARLDDAPDSAASIVEPFDTPPVVDASAHTIVLPARSGSVDCGVNVFISAPQRSSRLSQQHSFEFAGTSVDAEAGGTVSIPTTHSAYNLVAGDIVYVRLVQFGDAGGTQAGTVATEQIFRDIVVA